MNDSMEIQDGVAPQCAINGISKLQRVYIPIKKRSQKQLGFTQSHSIVNYDWIFNLPKNEGDVKTRN